MLVLASSLIASGLIAMRLTRGLMLAKRWLHSVKLRLLLGYWDVGRDGKVFRMLRYVARIANSLGVDLGFYGGSHHF